MACKSRCCAVTPSIPDARKRIEAGFTVQTSRAQLAGSVLCCCPGNKQLSRPARAPFGAPCNAVFHTSTSVR